MAQKYNNLILLLANIGKDVKTKYKNKLKTPDKNGYNAIASGKLFNSVDYKVLYKDGSVKLFFVAEDYYINVEDGRGIGKKMPPIIAIKRWILQKKLNKTPGMEYKIQRSISVLGIKPRPFLKQVSKDLVKTYKVQIEEALKKDVNVNIKVSIKKYKQVLNNVSGKDITIK